MSDSVDDLLRRDTDEEDYTVDSRDDVDALLGDCDGDLELHVTEDDLIDAVEDVGEVGTARQTPPHTAAAGLGSSSNSCATAIVRRCSESGRGAPIFPQTRLNLSIFQTIFPTTRLGAAFITPGGGGGEGFAPLRHIPVAPPPPLSNLRQIQTIRSSRRPPRNAAYVRPYPPPPPSSSSWILPPLSFPWLHPLLPLAPVTVDSNAQQSTEQLPPCTRLDDDDEIQIVEPGDAGTRVKDEPSQDYPYDNVTEDEVTFLEARPLSLNRLQPPELGEEGEEKEEVIIDLSSDDEMEEDDVACVTVYDDDEDYEPDVKPDIKPDLLNLLPHNEGTFVAATGKSLNARFEEQFAQKMKDIESSARPAVDPKLFKGRVSALRLSKAFRRLSPQEKARLIRKSGRREVLFRRIPRNWTEKAGKGVLENVCAAYGRVRGVFVRGSVARVVFREEEGAEKCELAMFNKVMNHRNEKVLVSRRFESFRA